MKKKGKKPTKNESSLFGLRICRHWVHAGAEEIPVLIQAQAPCSMKTVDTGRTESGLQHMLIEAVEQRTEEQVSMWCN